MSNENARRPRKNHRAEKSRRNPEISRDSDHNGSSKKTFVRTIFQSVGVRYSGSSVDVTTLPFHPGDVLLGTETELNAFVSGKAKDIDLAREITDSVFYAQARYDSKAIGKATRTLRILNEFLEQNDTAVWDYSWVSFGENLLCDFAKEIFEHDLLHDRLTPESGSRSDIGSFYRETFGGRHIRVPLSYLLKLALADYIGRHGQKNIDSLPFLLRCLESFSNDNTAPETISFYLESVTPSSREIGSEIAARYFLCHLLMEYAGHQFGLKESGQDAGVCGSPLPPSRLRRLNEGLSDNFFRKLFMNPCLSGWNRGEEKLRYMERCHDVLSRSKFHSSRRLSDLDIVSEASDSAALSTTSLLNNGIHASMSSRMLGRALGASKSRYRARHEKHYGDLVARCFEHCVPLFVGTYTAAPYIFESTSFNPQRALAYLPAQLHPTHLRAICQAWFRSDTGGRRREFVPDLRLLDYLVNPLATFDQSALDGKNGNHEAHKGDLHELGIFDSGLATYLLFRPREKARVGYTGFEARFFSSFPSVKNDFRPAVTLQALLTSFIYQLIAEEALTDTSIPSDPFSESERRQFVFAAAAGLTDVPVKRRNENAFLKRILRFVPESNRDSRSSSEFLSVSIESYLLGIIALLRKEGARVVAMYEADELLADLEARIRDPWSNSAAGRITSAVLKKAGNAALEEISAEHFNALAEAYYREEAKEAVLAESVEILKAHCPGVASLGSFDSGPILTSNAAAQFIESVTRFLFLEKEKALRQSRDEVLSTPDWEDAA